MDKGGYKRKETKTQGHSLETKRRERGQTDRRKHREKETEYEQETQAEKIRQAKADRQQQEEARDAWHPCSKKITPRRFCIFSPFCVSIRQYNVYAKRLHLAAVCCSYLQLAAFVCGLCAKDVQYNLHRALLLPL